MFHEQHITKSQFTDWLTHHRFLFFPLMLLAPSVVHVSNEANAHEKLHSFVGLTCA